MEYSSSDRSVSVSDLRYIQIQTFNNAEIYNG